MAVKVIGVIPCRETQTIEIEASSYEEGRAQLDARVPEEWQLQAVRTEKQDMAEWTKRQRIETVVVVTIASLASGALATVPNERWSAAWGNFFGALLVAMGGAIGCLLATKTLPEKASAWSWALVVVGGFAIAGASLQMVLFPAD